MKDSSESGIFKTRKAISPISIACYNFMTKSGEKIKVTAIIAPIVFEERERTVSITYGCSSGPSCYFPYCRYSEGYHRLER